MFTFLSLSELRIRIHGHRHIDIDILFLEPSIFLSFVLQEHHSTSKTQSGRFSSSWCAPWRHGATALQLPMPSPHGHLRIAGVRELFPWSSDPLFAPASLRASKPVVYSPRSIPGSVRMASSCRQFDLTFSGAGRIETKHHSPGRHSVIPFSAVGFSVRAWHHDPMFGACMSHDLDSLFPRTSRSERLLPVWLATRACQTPHRHLAFKVPLLILFRAMMRCIEQDYCASSGFLLQHASDRREPS
jgi:hypothetical protein